RALHVRQLGGLHRAVSIARDGYGLGNEYGGAAKRPGNLGLVPALAEDSGMLRLNMKAEDGGAGRLGQQHGSRFGHGARSARAVNCERGIPALSHGANHFFEGAYGTLRTRPARRAITMLLNDTGNIFAVEITTGHHYDSAISPEPRR